MGVSNGPPGTVLHFASAPQITPPAFTVTVDSAAAQRDGDIFLAAYPGPGRTGPTIFDPDGQLVWFKPLPLGTFATNVRVQRYAGHRVLTWWQGLVSIHGFGLGEGEIYSTAYRPVATIHAGDGLQEDLHELQLAPNGSALITTWKPLFCDLSAVGGPAYSAVYDAAFQEIDVRTGLVRYEWDSIEHLPLSDSYMPASGAKVSWPYDWFHLNSIALEPDGQILISARATWALYEIDPATGQVEWELGGRAPSFTMGPGTATAWQHDARALGPDTFSAFDNGGPPSSLQHSHGIVLRLDPQTHTVTLVDRIAIPTPIFSQTQGDLELLPDGNWWLGWGNVNQSSEVSPSGKLLFEAHTPERVGELSQPALPVERTAVHAPADGDPLALTPRRELERRDRRRELAARRRRDRDDHASGVHHRPDRLPDDDHHPSRRELRARRGNRHARQPARLLPNVQGPVGRRPFVRRRCRRLDRVRSSTQMSDRGCLSTPATQSSACPQAARGG